MNGSETVGLLARIGYPGNLLRLSGLNWDEGQLDAIRDELPTVLSRLSPFEQQIIELRYQRFYTIKAIAEEMGISNSVARHGKEGALRHLFRERNFFRLHKRYCTTNR